MKKYFTLRNFAIFVGASATVSLGSLQFLPIWFENRRMKKQMHLSDLNHLEQKAFSGKLVSREEHKNNLSSQEFDFLVIGGGATGSGIALDAISRGYSCALVEKFDFSSGTSSRSTKLIHGGVRYLQKAVFNLDIEQYRMVKEALYERANLVDIAPHLAQPIPIMLPLYKYWQIPYYWSGIKLYDLVSGSKILKASYFLNKTLALEQFPMLNKKNLVGALVYYDGQQEDARMNLSLVLSAARLGASICNYTEVQKLLKDGENNDKVIGATVKDRASGETYDIRAKVVINATGPYTDSIRTMEDDTKPNICVPSSGVHIVLPGYYSPISMGLLDPATKDGRIIFFLPWQNHTIAGTTDSACAIVDNPMPTEKEISFILDEVKHYLTPDIQVRRGDVLSAWSGIRPLVKDPQKTDTQSVARNHIIDISDKGLVTIAGGKWTTYRHMAEETLDEAIKAFSLPKKDKCNTSGLRIEGGHTWNPNYYIQLSQDYGLEPYVAENLSNIYGDKAHDVLRLCSLTGKRWPIIGTRLHPDYPYIEAEVRYACKEYAMRAVDVLARRTRLAFLNVHAAKEVLPRVIAIMGDELGWSVRKRAEEFEHATRFLQLEMGLELKSNAMHVAINFSKEETHDLVQQFHAMDKEKKGFLTVNDIKSLFTLTGTETVSDDFLREILNEVDSNRNGEIDIGEFLQFMSALKSGVVGDSRFKQIMRWCRDQR